MWVTFPLLMLPPTPGATPLMLQSLEMEQEAAVPLRVLPVTSVSFLSPCQSFTA